MKIIIEFDKEEEFDKIFDTLADKIASDVSDSIQSKTYKQSFEYRYAYKFKNVTFDCLEDARHALNELYDRLMIRGRVSVIDLYDLADVPFSISDRDYGWTDLEGVDVVSNGEGWIIDLKQPKYIRYLYPKEEKH